MYHRKPFWMFIVFFIALCSLPLVAQTSWELNRSSSHHQQGVTKEKSMGPEQSAEVPVPVPPPVSQDILSAKVRHVWPVHEAKFGFKTLLQAQIENTGNRPLPPESSVRFWVNGLNPSGPCLVGHSPVMGLRPGTTRWFTFVWSAPNTITGDGVTYQVQVCAGDTPLSPLSEPRVVEFANRDIGAPQLISPYDVSLHETPSFMWKSVAGATWYVLKIYGPPGKAIRKWYRSEDVTQGSACVGRLTEPLPKGSHTWCVQPWSVDGYGQSSEKKRFEIG